MLETTYWSSENIINIYYDMTNKEKQMKETIHVYAIKLDAQTGSYKNAFHMITFPK